ncbi:uncharacterized protein LOC134221097 [Armigeres subalbatus]|uniref:uncharacterized protein LOC134221097 n=1 Tax=Armigeres subalbatus TaxID=124917 RepID=UPI002ED01570
MPKIRPKRGKSRSSKTQKTPSPRKSYPRYEIPRSKLDAAIKFLEDKSQPKKGHRTASTLGCVKSILGNVTAPWKVDNYINDTANVLEVARHCALRGRWPELMKTVAILMEDIRRYDLPAALRNTLYAIIADPALNDPAFLEAYLFCNPHCTNQGDFKYCVDRILEVFQGVTIRSARIRGRVVSNEDELDESSDESDN